MRDTALFIDGSNIYATGKALGLDINYAKLKLWFGDNLLRANYYTAVIPQKEGMVDNLRPLRDWLSYNGYCVVTKDTKEFVDKITGKSKIKGNMDTEITVDALELAPRIKHAVLFSGDGDFTYLVKALQRKGVRVTAISTLETEFPMIADELRRAVDEFVDLKVFIDLINQAVVKETVSRGGSRYA